MPSPALALFAGLVALGGLSLLLWPELGLFWRWQRLRRMSERTLGEDALKHVYNCEVEGRRPTVHSLAGALGIKGDRAAGLLDRLHEAALLTLLPDGIRLTSIGRQSALHILRAHRLWERHLADNTGYRETEWHDLAERFEHQLTPEAADALAVRLQHPTHDPHGDPIPAADGRWVASPAISLTAAPVTVPLRIVHIEDEPESVFAQLVAEGLHPGMLVRVIERDPTRLRVWAAGDEHLLAPLVAANISVCEEPQSADASLPRAGRRLSDLRPGECAQVLSILPSCRKNERRRLYDLGLLPGTQIEVEFPSPGGDPIAYRVRGALLALRSEQTRHIVVDTASQDA
jgi:DtxR family transcriptional regulator, Mn-dependent transcriptional regulator